MYTYLGLIYPLMLFFQLLTFNGEVFVHFFLKKVFKNTYICTLCQFSDQQHEDNRRKICLEEFLSRCALHIHLILCTHSLSRTFFYFIFMFLFVLCVTIHLILKWISTGHALCSIILYIIGRLFAKTIHVLHVSLNLFRCIFSFSFQGITSSIY